MDDIESIIREVSGKDSSVLCREVTSIGDTMDVLRSKWVPEILTAIICGNTRFTDIQAAVHGLSDKVLADRLRQLTEDKLLDKTECYGYPPRVEYRLTEQGKRLYAIIYRMTEWGQEHRGLMIKQSTFQRVSNDGPLMESPYICGQLKKTTEPVYRNPYWPTWPLIQITQSCTHNRCKFCTMYKGIPFRMQPLEDIEADAAEIASMMPDARTIQLLSANPLAMSFENLMPRLEIIKKNLPKLEHMYTATRVSDLKNKTVAQLKALRDIGLNEISLGVESGDDWTLQRIDKGYTSAEILEQCHKLEEAGIAYWVTFLNGVAGREHSRDHAINTAKIFNQLKPMLVGTGGLTLFPGTPLLEEAQQGEFDPLSEKEMLEELRLFVEHLEIDCTFITHHTVAANLTGPGFLSRKDSILAVLDEAIEHGDHDRLAAIRQNKRTL